MISTQSILIFIKILYYCPCFPSSSVPESNDLVMKMITGPVAKASVQYLHPSIIKYFQFIKIPVCALSEMFDNNSIHKGRLCEF